MEDRSIFLRGHTQPNCLRTWLQNLYSLLQSAENNYKCTFNGTFIQGGKVIQRLLSKSTIYCYLSSMMLKKLPIPHHGQGKMAPDWGAVCNCPCVGFGRTEEFVRTEPKFGSAFPHVHHFWGKFFQLSSTNSGEKKKIRRNILKLTEYIK